MGRGFKKISFDQFRKDLSGLDNLVDLHEGIIMPQRATKFSAGYDISTPFDFTIKPGEVKTVPTGLKVFFNDDEMFYIVIRSSVGFKNNVRLVNQVGIFESDYYDNESNEGHIFIKLQNHGLRDATFRAGDRIVQGIFTKYLTVDDDSASDMRVGGIGSTGKGIK